MVKAPAPKPEKPGNPPPFRPLRPRAWLMAGLAALAVFGGYFLAPRPAPKEPAQPECVIVDPARADLSKGARIYEDVCAFCHGKNLEGETADWRERKPDGSLPAPPHDESGHTWHHPDDLLFRIVKDGGQSVVPDMSFVSKMPGYKDALPDERIKDVLAFIKSHWPEAIRLRQADMSKRACAK